MFLFKRNETFYIEYFDQQSQKKKRISTGYRNKSEALKFLHEFSPKPPAVRRSNKILIRQFLNEYISFARESYSNAYIRSIILAANKFIEFIGDREIKDICARDVEHFISKTYARANYAAHLYYRTLKAAFSKAVIWEYINDNPFKKIKPAKTQKKIPVFITFDELKNVIDKEKNNTLKKLYLFAFFTGLRQSEILNLKWKDIDFERSLITLGNSQEFITKSKHARVVPLKNEIINTLIEIKQSSKSEFVFADFRGYRFKNDFVTKSFKKAVRKTELPDSVHFHSLRHSFASCLAQNGASLYSIKEILGHQNIATTQIYAHLNNKSLFDAISYLPKSDL